MHSALVLAQKICLLAKKDGGVIENNICGEKISQLLYIAQGMNLFINRGPLFSDQVEALKFGVSIHSLRYCLRKREHSKVMDSIVSNIPNVSIEDVRSITYKDDFIISLVCSKFKTDTYDSLNNLLLKEYSPIRMINDEFGDIEIQDSETLEYFTKLIEEEKEKCLLELIVEMDKEIVLIN